MGEYVDTAFVSAIKTCKLGIIFDNFLSSRSFFTNLFEETFIS